MKIIAFAGVAAAGKTLAAKVIEEKIANGTYGVPVLEHFAGPLKMATHLLGAEKDKQPRLYRKLCQEIGNNLRDPTYMPGVTGPDYWVNCMAERLKFWEEDEVEDFREVDREDDVQDFRETVVIIDDVRYQNEVDMIRSAGGVLVYVDATKRADINLNEEFRKHPSEQLAVQYSEGLLEDELFDFTIPNNGKQSAFVEVVKASIGDLLSFGVPEWRDAFDKEQGKPDGSNN